MTIPTIREDPMPIDLTALTETDWLTAECATARRIVNDAFDVAKRHAATWLPREYQP